MVWTLFLLILISIGDSLSDECTYSVWRVCDSSLLPRSYPESPQGLMTICENFQTYKNCELGLKENCETTDEKELDEIRKVLSFLNSTCVEDNPTFKVLASQLQCMKPIVGKMMGKPCLSIMSDETIDIVTEHLWPLYENYRSGFANCLEDMINIKCAAVVLGYHCGEAVKNAVVELGVGVGVSKRAVCTEEYLEEMQQFLEVFEKTFFEQIQFENEDDKRK